MFAAKTREEKAKAASAVMRRKRDICFISLGLGKGDIYVLKKAFSIVKY